MTDRASYLGKYYNLHRSTDRDTQLHPLVGSRIPLVIMPLKTIKHSQITQALLVN